MQKTFFTVDNRKELLYQLAILAIILAGIVLRSSKYLPGWSMRVDELSITLNLLHRSATELLTKPLDHEQAAPVCFLITLKGLATLLGPSDYVLRLVAFVTGCIAIVLMYWLLHKISGRYGTLFGLLAFAASHYLIFYSAEIKQYSSDVFVTLALVRFFHHHLTNETSKKDFWIFGLVGVWAICFSHPAIFVLISIGLTLLMHHWKNKQKLVWTMLMGSGWAVTFLIIYLMLLRLQTTSPYLIKFWGDLNSYMPLRFWRNLSWFPDSLAHLFTNIGGLATGISVVLIALYMFGVWQLWKQGKWQWMLVAVLPVGINMLVSGFEKFPFHGRLIMYLLPLVFIVFAAAIDGLVSLMPNRFAANLLFLGLVVILLRPAAPTAYSFLFSKSYLLEDLRPVLAFMHNHIQSDDNLYLYHNTIPQFDYYAPQYELENFPTTYGQDYSSKGKDYLDELSSLPRGQRIWFVFSFVGDVKVSKKDKQNEREYILHYLNDNGSLLTEYYSRNDASSAHLYILK